MDTLRLSLGETSPGLSAAFLLSWRGSVAEGARRLRERATDQAAARVSEFLEGADAVVRAIDARVRDGRCPIDAGRALDSCLLASLVEHPHLDELAFTHGDDDPAKRWQAAVRRSPEGLLCTRRVHAQAGEFVADEACQPPDALLLPAKPRPSERAGDPTGHLSFETPAAGPPGRTLLSDLSWAQSDDDRPEPERRVVVVALRAVAGRGGAIAGVVRAAVREDELDREIRGLRVNPEPNDPFRVFLSDLQGRLVTRLLPGQRLMVDGDDLRVVPEGAPPEVRAALRQPELADLGESDRGDASARFQVEGRRYLARYHALPGTQDWCSVIVGTEDYYLAPLARAGRRLAGVAGALLLVMLVLGVVGVRAVRGGLHRIVDEGERLRRFSFAPASVRSPFADVKEALEGLEQAKTALRALGKYVPVDLVRALYAANREPVLGAEARDVTLLFTDIEGFTTISETLAPDALARALGRYLEVMTAAIHASGGTIDKFIGDAIMVLWNAPTPCEDAPARACAAVLACERACAKLFTAPEWGALPPFRTRYGVHRAEVLVGHFGAPERLSYTALGDGVNLASRLEGLNKLYGTRILVSQTVMEAARGRYAFRRLDRVAVKGKSHAVDVFELLGEAADPSLPLERARIYERAFAAYVARDFAGALRVLEPQLDDPPSGLLAARCRHLLEEPPPDDWSGVYTAKEK